MTAKTSAHYQREFRKRLRLLGLVKKEVWILPEHARQLAVVERELRLPGNSNLTGIGENAMTAHISNWTTNSLFDALDTSEFFNSGQATIELIDGAEPSLHIIMKEFGDLPVFLTVAGEQIIVEALLWPQGDVSDPIKFNEAVLRTHKFFPLSTISLETHSSGNSYYHMFGALSSTSLLYNVLFEIETLANNVIQVTEAYREFLAIPAQAV